MIAAPLRTGLVATIRSLARWRGMNRVASVPPSEVFTSAPLLTIRVTAAPSFAAIGRA